MIEVMVSFMVLLITLAFFTSAINFASSAQMRSTDAVREADNEYTSLRATINTENMSNNFGGLSDTGLTNPKSITVTGTDGSNITLNAYQYTSGDSIFWVYR